MSAAPDLDRLAEDLAEVMVDFQKFCGLLQIKTKSDGLIFFDHSCWHDEQRRFDAQRSGWDVVLKPRQIGFSTLELARDLWLAVTREGYNVQVVVHDGKLKKQLFEALRLMASSLGELGLLPETLYSTTTELVFKHTGSAVRIVEAGSTDRSAQGKGRSGTIQRLHATEQAFWLEAATTMGGILGSLVGHEDGGELCIESTANGAGGLFFDTVKAAKEPGSQYKLHFFPWYGHKKYRRPCPPDFDPAPRDKWEKVLRRKGCDDQQIAWWRAKWDDPNFGPDKTLQEHPVDSSSCFRASGREYYDPETIDSLTQTVRPLLRLAPLQWKGLALGEAHIFINPKPGRSYVIGGDVSEGLEEDGHAAAVLDYVTGDLCATYWLDNIEPGDFGLALGVLGWLYNKALVGPERNNHGHAAIRALTREMKYPNLYRDKNKKVGWDTNPATRPPLFDELYKAHRTGAYDCPDTRVLSEIQTIIIDKDGRPRARGKGKPDGCKDDLFMAYGIAHQLRSSPKWQGGGFKFKGA